jgi:hypothetical protein
MSGLKAYCLLLSIHDVYVIELEKIILGVIHIVRTHWMGGGGYGKAFQMRALNVKAMGAYACGEGKGSKNYLFFACALYG